MFGHVYNIAFRRVVWIGTFKTSIRLRFLESVISEIHQLCGWSFFRKNSKFKPDFKNEKKKWERVFCFWDNCIWIGCVEFSLLRGEYLSWAVNVLTNTLKILRITNKFFVSQLLSQWSINMVKVLSFRFRQCFDPFTMLLFEGLSEAELFRNWFKHVFWSP